MMDQIDKSGPPDLESQERVGLENNTDDSTVATLYDFVDYTPPKTANILPPAKYKLFVLIDVLVVIGVWFADEAELVKFLNFGGWLSPEAALFLFLVIIDAVLIYGTLDLLVWVLTFRVDDGNGKKKEVGIGAWLKAPRCTWIYRYQNVFAESLAVVIRILEDGFEMFDAPPRPRSGVEMPRCITPCPDGSTGGCHQKVLKIEHRINPEKIKEYIRWEEKIANAADENATGLISVEKKPYKGQDGKEMKIKGQNDSLLLDATACKDMSLESGSLLREIKLTFKDLVSLNDWMVLPRRRFLMDDLQSFLVVPDVVQIRLDRELPDAFTDLMIRQGEFVPRLPPLKWKVCWLTTVALYISIAWVSSFMDHYVEFWGLNDAHVRILALVINTITVWVNTYIFLPLFLLIFDNWIKRKEVETKVTKESWRTLNDGFQSMWSKAFLTFAFYGGCAIVWIVRS